MNKIQFIGQLTETNFGKNTEEKKKPFYIKKMGNKELALKSALMGVAGYGAGKKVHDLVKSQTTRSGRILYTPKGGRKAGLIGAALTTGLTAGTGLLLRRIKNKTKK